MDKPRLVDADKVISKLSVSIRDCDGSEEDYVQGGVDGYKWIISMINSGEFAPDPIPLPSERSVKWYQDLTMKLNDDLNGTEAREQKLKEAIDFVIRNHMLEHACDAYEHFQEVLSSLYPLPEKEGEAK